MLENPVRIAVVGTGYVGLVTGACFADWGHKVVCVDRDEVKIAALKKGRIPIYEPGLEVIVARAVESGCLSFTSDMTEAVKDAEVVFLGVGTPTLKGTNHADVSAVYAAAESVCRNLTQDAVLVTKSTVPVGTAEQLRARIAKLGIAHRVEVASNPEFLREGSAVIDFMKPDRVIIGADSTFATSLLERVYDPIRVHSVPIVVSNTTSAELIKYAANAFLATKVTFINEMADIAERLGADITKVAHGIGLDHRIGTAFLNPGPGFGGSCFPKDTRALAAIAQDCGSPSRLVDAVISANHNRMTSMIHRIIVAVGGSLHHKRVAVLGLTFKANTDDMRESVSMIIIPALLHEGAEVVAHDPAGMEHARALLPPDVHYADSPEDCIKGADVTVVLTEWDAYKRLPVERFSLMPKPVVVDMRNLYPVDAMKKAGVTYYSLGRPPVMA